MLTITSTEQRFRKPTYDRSYSAKPRIYIFPEGSNVFNWLEERYKQPSKAYKKEVMPKLVEQLGITSDMKLKWSQYAGCSCGCSPGFIVEGDTRKYDVFVHVTAE